MKPSPSVTCSTSGSFTLESVAPCFRRLWLPRYGWKDVAAVEFVTEAAVGDDLASTEGDPAVVFSLFHRCSG